MADDLFALNQRLLEAISAGDWETYTEICDPDLTCFEPETDGHLVEGLEFHKFYFDNGSRGSARQETMVEPHLQMLSDESAITCCVRLVQRRAEDGSFVTDRFSETRVWKRTDGEWKHVHFHRSRVV